MTERPADAGSSPKASSVRRSSSLHFPKPHQLGISSTGIHPSRSRGGSFSFFRHQFSDVEVFRSQRVSMPTESNLVTHSIGRDETDSGSMGPPPTKKAAMVSRSAKIRTTKAKKPKPIVKTYDEKPLKEFILFLPPILPKSISTSRSALQDFVRITTITHLSLWELASKMEVVELRFPLPYIEMLSEDGLFLKELLVSVFDQISYVKSIDELYLPKISLHPLAKLDDILEALSETKCSISHLFIPIRCLLQSKELDVFEFKQIASFLSKTNVREITFVSTDKVVQEFSDKIFAELKHIKKCSTRVNSSDEELGAPGPNYISDLDKKPVVGEEIDPHVLVSSLNATSPANEEVKRSSGATHIGSRHKMVKNVTLSCVSLCTTNTCLYAYCVESSWCIFN